MLLTRDAIREDKSFGLLTDAILERDQPRTTDLFFQMVKRQGRSVGEALSVVTAAEAPFVQVPNHINVRDGQITLINNDHTILGLRTSTHLAPFLPEPYRLLPLLQSVWYIPAGLDIWNQLLGRYPGRYATMKGMQVPPPSYGPEVWNEEQAPIKEAGTVEERLHAHLIATMSGDVRRSYGLFLGLAEDPEIRPMLRDQLLFLGPHRSCKIRWSAGRRATPATRRLRARAVLDLADVLGWERAHGVYYMGVPDMAIGPLYYSLYDAACVTISAEFPDAGKGLKKTNQTPLTEAEVEEMIPLLMEADWQTVWNRITAHLKNGKSLRSLGDTLQLGAAELILSTTDPAELHERSASVRLLQRGELLAADERQPLSGARPLHDGQLHQRRRPCRQAVDLVDRARDRRRGHDRQGAGHAAARARRGHPGVRRPAHHRAGPRLSEVRRRIARPIRPRSR